MPLPKISVITPSFNQGRFLEATIISVLGQGYSNLEYIIMDGGSTDNSVDVIKKYADKLYYWISKKDGGQSDAINLGFQIATGEILMWLNSDDLLMPGALSFIAEKTDLEMPGVYFGNCIHFENNGALTCIGSNVVKEHKTYSLENKDYIIQPSSFWTRHTWNLVGQLDEKMNFAFDWEWFLRAKQKNVPFISLSECISLYRIHESHKTGTGSQARDHELAMIYRNYAPSNEKLFNHLSEDKFLLNGRLPNLIKKFSRIMRHPVSDMRILKWLKPKRYNSYSNDNITQVMEMVSHY